MRGYNIWRPIMLILVALLTRSLVTNLCVLFGMAPDSASSVAMFAMIIVAFVMYNRMMKRRRK
ncbi:hypothetical protein [Paenibacillus monticola]|uniref:Uncharacterized protein n=1 Tax=Paenibacillus monticola TaxID=2666075 RepID=A0A7X2L443_9BACL|nr:hypothetical protein [Paenibacillus monticola]MRN56647.1 hypothetical protein [Paenibacillus monticola]